MTDAQGNRYGPYDTDVALSEAEAFTEDAWYLLHRESGVVSGGALTFTGLTAHLAPFELRSHGSFLARTAEWTDASPPTSTSAPRRDMLVARRQRTAGSGVGAVPGKTFLTVLRGTPAATPAEPTTYDPVNDEPLWSWQVPGSGGTVITGVRDLRRWLNPAPGRLPRIFTPRAFDWIASGLGAQNISAGGSNETGFGPHGAQAPFTLLAPTRMLFTCQFRVNGPGAAVCSIKVDGTQVGPVGIQRTDDETIAVTGVADLAAGSHTPSLRVDANAGAVQWLSFYLTMVEGAAE